MLIEVRLDELRSGDYVLVIEEQRANTVWLSRIADEVSSVVHRSTDVGIHSTVYFRSDPPEKRYAYRHTVSKAYIDVDSQVEGVLSVLAGARI